MVRKTKIGIIARLRIFMNFYIFADMTKDKHLLNIVLNIILNIPLSIFYIIYFCILYALCAFLQFEVSHKRIEMHGLLHRSYQEYNVTICSFNNFDIEHERK